MCNEKEKYVNDYNPIILLIWGANIDIQYIKESSTVLNRYITTYMTKSEKNFNDQMTKILQIDTITIKAIDTIPVFVSNKKTKLKKKKLADTAGLETELKIGVGCRVMLTRNIDISNGLTNGS